MSNLGAFKTHAVGNEFGYVQLGAGAIHAGHNFMAVPTGRISRSYKHHPNYQPLRFRHIFLVLTTGLAIAGMVVGGLVLAEGRDVKKSFSAASSVTSTPTQPARPQLSKLEQILQQTVSIKVNGQTLQPTKQELAALVTENADHSVSANLPAINTYIGKLAAANTTKPLGEIVVTHPDGTTSTLVNGINGFTPDDLVPIATNFAEQLTQANGVKVELPGTSLPFRTITTPEYTKLLEVDLTNKRMYAYEGDNLIRTFLTTAGAPATPTPAGRFYIWQKLTIQNMRGYNADGTKYLQPNVRWINYFDHSGDAVHGNYWRPASVFGNTNTSHGCVSVIESEAKWIYDWAPIGTTVITYY